MQEELFQFSPLLPGGVLQSLHRKDVFLLWHGMSLPLPDCNYMNHSYQYYRNRQQKVRSLQYPPEQWGQKSPASSGYFLLVQALSDVLIRFFRLSYNLPLPVHYQD